MPLFMLLGQLLACLSCCQSTRALQAWKIMQGFVGELCWCFEWDGYLVSWRHKRLSSFIRRIFYKAWERSCASVKTSLVNSYHPHTATDCSRVNQQMLMHSHRFLWTLYMCSSFRPALEAAARGTRCSLGLAAHSSTDSTAQGACPQPEKEKSQC